MNYKDAIDKSYYNKVFRRSWDQYGWHEAPHIITISQGEWFVDEDIMENVKSFNITAFGVYELDGDGLVGDILYSQYYPSEEDKEANDWEIEVCSKALKCKEV